jgi:outer membrane protein assembly factor BamD
MFFKAVKPLFLIFTIVLLSACSDYNKVLKSNDIELKYTRAVEYYDEGSTARPLSF